jgi:hypothetical protein
MSYYGCEKLKPKGMPPMEFPIKDQRGKVGDVFLIVVGLIGLLIVAGSVTWSVYGS